MPATKGHGSSCIEEQQMEPLFSSQSIPDYHDGMLLVQLRPSAAPIAGAAAAAITASGEPASSGIAAMAFYERAGLIKRVVPVARRRSVAGGPASLGTSGAFGATATLLGASAFGRVNADAGVSVVELERDE